MGTPICICIASITLKTIHPVIFQEYVKLLSHTLTRSLRKIYPLLQSRNLSNPEERVDLRGILLCICIASITLKTIHPVIFQEYVKLLSHTLTRSLRKIYPLLQIRNLSNPEKRVDLRGILLHFAIIFPCLLAGDILF